MLGFLESLGVFLLIARQPVGQFLVVLKEKPLETDLVRVLKGNQRQTNWATCP